MGMIAEAKDIAIASRCELEQTRYLLSRSFIRFEQLKTPLTAEELSSYVCPLARLSALPD